MVESETAESEVVRWYTRARRFPQLIGRTPDGAQIPGGPYTFTQVIGTAAFLVVAVKTINLWGRFDLIGNALVLFVAAAAVVFGLGRLPIGARNPFSLLDGTLRAVTAPAAGRVDGRSVRIRRPRYVRSKVVVHVPQVDVGYAEAIPEPEDAAQPVLLADVKEEEPAVVPPPPPSTTGLAATPPAARPTGPETTPPPRRTGQPLTGVQQLLATRPHRSREAA